MAHRGTGAIPGCDSGSRCPPSRRSAPLPTQTRSAAVRNAAMSLLISLHVRLDPSSGLVVGRVVQDFAHSILDRLHLIHS